MFLRISASYLFFLLLLLATNVVCAQTFAPDSSIPQKRTDPFSAPAGIRSNTAKKTESIEATDDTIDTITQALSTSKTKKSSDTDDTLDQLSKSFSASNKQQQVADDISEEDDDEDIEKEEDIFIPEGELYRLNTPTLDGSIRGGQAFVEVDEKGRMKKTTKIFLFYDEFRILNPNAQVPTCNVRFNILSTLDRKVSQLDVKLVWPGLTTTLSFSDIMPNTQTYYNYALLSAGCYNMDKAPNIIVNRCRVKGMTAAECANKLLWLSK